MSSRLRLERKTILVFASPIEEGEENGSTERRQPVWRDQSLRIKRPSVERSARRTFPTATTRRRLALGPCKGHDDVLPQRKPLSSSPLFDFTSHLLQALLLGVLLAPQTQGQQCNTDVLFLLDASGSVSNAFESMVRYITGVAEALTIGPGLHRVAILEYSSEERAKRWPRIPFDEIKVRRKVIGYIGCIVACIVVFVSEH